MPTRDPRVNDAAYAAATLKSATCRHQIASEPTDDAVRDAPIKMLRRYDIAAVTGGPRLDHWRAAGGERIIPSLEFGLADAPPPERIHALAQAGYGKRMMYGSDQMAWPGSIPAFLAAIRTAPFLTAAQKRDILHDSAARFLRLP